MILGLVRKAEAISPQQRPELEECLGCLGVIIKRACVLGEFVILTGLLETLREQHLEMTDNFFMFNLNNIRVILPWLSQLFEIVLFM